MCYLLFISEYLHQGCSLKVLLDWAWQKVSSTKHQIDTTCKRYFSFCRLVTTLSWLLRNIVGKGENAGNQHFLFLPKCFLPYQNTEMIIFATFKLSSVPLNLVESLLFGKA